MSPSRLRQPSILAVFLIRAREDQAAIRSVAALGDVLRGALRQTEPEVALRHELGLAERYLDLERARFGDTLSFSVEAEPDTAAAQVPSSRGGRDSTCWRRSDPRDRRRWCS